jgi:hypothetical protein
MTGRIKLDWVVLKQANASARTAIRTEAGFFPRDAELVAAKTMAQPTRRGAAGGAATGVDRARRAPVFEVEASKMTTDETRERLSEPGVFGAVLNMPMMLIRSVKPPAPARTRAAQAWGIGAVGADRIPNGGEGVVVAVLDTGIEREHPAFAGKSIEVRNFCDGEPDHDADGHGTHCAGTIFGDPVDGTRIGIAPGIDKALIGKVIGERGGSSEAIIRAIYWAQSAGADIISMSLGIDFPGFQKMLVEKHGLDPRAATSIALTGYTMNLRAFDTLSRSIIGQAGLMPGAVVAAAAGNESQAPEYTIMSAPPSSAADFVSVAALDRRLTLAPFSNVGAKLAAPGVDIVSAGLGGRLASMSGTSMATPHVAGVAALWASKLVADGGNDSFSAAKVIELMRRQAQSLEPRVAARDVEWGLVRAPQ